MNARKVQITDTSRWLPIAMILAALALSVAGFILYQNFYHDDAYISLRYVHNFLDGQGLVWNPGEWVEGYSNFLWVILVSLLGYFGTDLVIASKILGITSLLVTGVVAWKFYRRHCTRSVVTPALAVLLIFSALPMIV